MAGGIDYGGMMHRAMQGLIADVLREVARDGLPGEHHFFITFDTRDSGVEMADWLREALPKAAADGVKGAIGLAVITLGYSYLTH